SRDENSNLKQNLDSIEININSDPKEESFTITILKKSSNKTKKKDKVILNQLDYQEKKPFF
ncbi:939_t:CDS:1, partial [Scutellospora calospora]